MSVECEIDFWEHPVKVISQNKSVFGDVTIKVTKDTTIRGLYVKTLANVRIHWTNTFQMFFADEEDIEIDRTTFVKDRDFQLKTSHVHRFMFMHYMKPEFPSSFESEFGSVKYNVVVVVEHENGTGQIFETPITVIKTVDLNDDLTFRRRISAEETAVVYQCSLFRFCNPGPLGIIVTTGARGYVPEEIIDLCILVDNKSNRAVAEFVVQLIQVITYQTSKKLGEHSKLKEEVITETKTRGCQVHKSEMITVRLEVPSSVIPTDIESNLIRIQYLCRVMAKDCKAINAILNLPLTIGTIAFDDDARNIPQEATTQV